MDATTTKYHQTLVEHGEEAMAAKMEGTPRDSEVEDDVRGSQGTSE